MHGADSVAPRRRLSAARGAEARDRRTGGLTGGPEDCRVFPAAGSSGDLCEGRGDKWAFLKLHPEKLLSVWRLRNASQPSADSAQSWIRTKVLPAFWASEKHNQIAWLSH